MPLTLGPPGRGADRTRSSVLRWAAALPAAQYAITAIPADRSVGTATHRRCWNLQELEGALSWLRRLNSTGHHIVGRPIDPRHVLVDDLHPDALTALCRHHRPAAVVSSSPGSLQAWLTLSDTPIVPALADAAAKILAARYGGDLCAARASQPGRIAGFTNRKPKHQAGGTGLFPYALLLRDDGPIIDPGGAALLREAREALAKSPSPLTHPAPLTGSAQLQRPPAEAHAAGLERVIASLPPGVTLDRSRADYAIARRLVSRGFLVVEVVSVLLAGERARGMPSAAAQAYARRTAEAAAAQGRCPSWETPH
ncbi:DNA-primase RepB domain-containing protein [Roseomonas harenae]|uniref:DNA-primase RepB domain-containing protein n=1 Tax=Muricoccus harenae TaxID=2692566 RepID=UPI0013311D43|nr:DNA-primase RepB domain-containing protein [Roseomonas harenae]